MEALYVNDVTLCPGYLLKHHLLPSTDQPRLLGLCLMKKTAPNVFVEPKPGIFVKAWLEPRTA